MNRSPVILSRLRMFPPFLPTLAIMQAGRWKASMQLPDHLARSSLSKTDRSAIIVAAQKIGHEVGMNGRAQMNLERILLQHFRDVRTVTDAHAIGVDAWLDANATMAVIKALFPDAGRYLSQ